MSPEDFEQIRRIMSPEEREKKLAAIRADRLARGGKPAPSEESVIRSVVASMRLAGHDARTHFGLPADWKPGDPIGRSS